MNFLLSLYVLVLYSCKQKHVLLFRKSEFLLYKALINNMPQFFLGTKLLKIES